MHAVVARSTFPSQNVQSTPCSDHFRKLRCRKKCTLSWREAHFQIKMYKTHHARTTFGSWHVSSCGKSTRCCGAKHISKSKVYFFKWRVQSTFGRSDVVLRGRREGLCTLLKVSKMWRFCIISKTMAGVGHLKRIYKDAFSVAGAVQETCSSELLGGQGADFLREVALWSIRSSGLLRWFLRDRCSTSYDLASLFPGRRSTFRQVEWKNRRTHWYEAVSSALNFPFLKEVSRNCLFFDVVNFEYWRKSRNIASFLTLSSSKIEEVSQNRFVFKLAERQIDR